MKSQLKWLATATCAAAIGSLWAAPALDIEFTRVGTSSANQMYWTVARNGGEASAPTLFTASLVASTEAQPQTASRLSAKNGESADFFYANYSSSGTISNVSSGYPMVNNQFISNNNTTDHYWRIWLPVTLEANDSFNMVLPEIYATTSSGGSQTSDARFFSYTIKVYTGAVYEDTAAETKSAALLATATGLTHNSKDLNTEMGAFDRTLSGLSGTYTLSIEVHKNACGGGAYSGIKSVQLYDAPAVERTVSGETNDWNTESAWSDGAVPGTLKTAVLQVADNATLTLNVDATPSMLQVLDGSTSGTPSLTFAGTGSLTTASTTINVSTDVSAITASLGAVTLASGKTLTVGNKGAFTSLAGTGGTLALNATKASINYSASDGELEALRTYNGKVIFKGTNANAETSTVATGVTLPYAIGKGTMSAKFAFDGGTHTFQYGANSTSSFFGPQGTDDDPTLEVKNGATLNFCTKDLSGWQSSTNSEKVILRVRGGGTLNFTQYVSTQDETAYFNNRLVLDNGATVDIQNTDGYFRMNGGVRTEATAQLAMLGGATATAASVTGGKITLASDETAGVGVSVGANATLTIENEIAGDAGRTFAKYGAGTLVLSGAFTGSPITVNTGTLDFAVAEGDDRTIAVGISGAGTVKKSGAGTLKLTGTVSAPVEVEAGALDLGTNRPTLGAVAEDAILKLTATTTEATAGAMVLPTTLLAAPDKARFSVENGNRDTLEISSISLVNGTLIIRSASATPTRTLTLSANGSTGSWNDGSTDWPTSGTVIIDATALEADAEVALPASAIFDELIVLGSSAKTTLTVGEETTITTLSPLGYVAMEVDAVNAITNTNPVTVAAGGIFEVTVKTGETKTLSKAITGAGKFAKGGSGTLTLSKNITTTGGSIVQSGTLQFSSSGYVNATSYDDATGDVTVCANATLDLNGKIDLWLRTITLAGGATYKNSGTAVGDGKRQLREIVLTGDATVSGADFGLVASGFGPATLDLGGYTLTKEGTGSFWLTNCTISNGTLAVKEGTIVGNSKATSCRISGEVTLERAQDEDAVDTAKFVFTQATTEDSALTVQEGATLKTKGPGVAGGIDLGYLILTGGLVANSDVSIAHLKSDADKTLTGTGTITVKDATLAESVTLTTVANMVLDLSACTEEASPKTIAAKVVVGEDSGARDSVTLTTKGYLTLSNESNKIAETGKLLVASDITTLSAGQQGLQGNLAIASGATLKSGSNDVPRWGEVAQSFDIAGTLELTGTAYWSINPKATVALHEGAILKGTGPENSRALDFFEGGTITADGDATIEATLGAHNGNKTLTITPSAGKTTTLSGEVRNELKLKAAGSGTVVYAPAGVTSTSSPLVVDAGATLELLPEADFTLRGALSGRGAITLGGTGEVNVTAANGDYDGTITINSEATLTNKDHGEPIPFGKGRIVNKGTLKLIAGTKVADYGCALLPPTSGTGDIVFCSGSETRIPGEISTTGTITFEAASGNKVAAKVTFVTSGDFPDQAASISRANVVVGSGVTLANADKNGATSPTVTIDDGKTLSGGGTIKVPVTFAETAKILIGTKDVYPTILGTITLPETNKIRVDLPSATRFLAAATDSGLTLENFALVNETPALTDHHLSSTDPSLDQVIFSLVKKTALPSGVNTEEFDDAVTAALALWESYGIRVSEITQISPATSSGTKVEDGSRSIDAAALFTNVLSIVPDSTDFETTAKASVSYDFGVADMTIKDLQLEGDTERYVLLAAKVQNSVSSNTADFASGITLTVMNGETELDSKSVTAAQAGAVEETGVRWLAVPLKTLFPDIAPTGTQSLKVKASKAAAN